MTIGYKRLTKAFIATLGLMVAAQVTTVGSQRTQAPERSRSQPTERAPQLTPRSMSGKDLFGFYCATCHGRDGRGNGPAAAALKTMPADLTRIAARREGRFPRSEIAAIIATENRSVTAHGSADMPVWGPIFRGLDTSEPRNEMRIENLVTYLESIQAK
jgi:mono/diheme cytochrome c family protein